MSSPFRNASGAVAAVAALLAVGAVRAQTPGTNLSSTPGFVATTTLFPGSGSAPAMSAKAKGYEGNAEHIANGQRLFEWYNCAGCHFHGGGGMGPALMDNQWIYGGRLDQIHASLVQGRPNGMPSWGHKIPDAELWEIAAYVKSLSASSAANGPGQSEPKTPPPPAR